MATLAKIYGIDVSSLSKIYGIDISSIGKLYGVDLEAGIGDMEWTMEGPVMRNNNTEAWTLEGFRIM
jgi:hypothetical protein